MCCVTFSTTRMRMCISPVHLKIEKAKKTSLQQLMIIIRSGRRAFNVRPKARSTSSGGTCIFPKQFILSVTAMNERMTLGTMEARDAISGSHELEMGLDKFMKGDSEDHREIARQIAGNTSRIFCAVLPPSRAMMVGRRISSLIAENAATESQFQLLQLRSLCDQGMFEDAAEEYSAAIETFHQALGIVSSDPPPQCREEWLIRRAVIRTHIGKLSLKYHGYASIARMEFETTLHELKAAFGNNFNHHVVVEAYTNLSLAHAHEGNMGQSKDAIEAAMQRLERLSDPLLEAQCYNTMGMILARNGHLVLAMDRFNHSLRIREEVFGPSASPSPSVTHHHSIAESLLNLAYFEPKPNQALELYQRAASILTRTLGPDSIALSQALDGLGVVLCDLGRSHEAVPSFRRALAIREARLGTSHLDVAQSLHNLASAIQVVVSTHPSTSSSVHSLAAHTLLQRSTRSIWAQLEAVGRTFSSFFDGNSQVKEEEEEKKEEEKGDVDTLLDAFEMIRRAAVVRRTRGASSNELVESLLGAGQIALNLLERVEEELVPAGGAQDLVGGGPGQEQSQGVTVGAVSDRMVRVAAVAAEAEAMLEEAIAVASAAHWSTSPVEMAQETLLMLHYRQRSCQMLAQENGDQHQHQHQPQRQRQE